MPNTNYTAPAIIHSYSHNHVKTAVKYVMVCIRQYEEQTSYLAHKHALCDSQSSVYTLGIVDAV